MIFFGTVPVTRLDLTLCRLIVKQILVIDRYIGRLILSADIHVFLRVSYRADTRLIFADIFFAIIYKQVSTQAAPCC